MDIVPIIVCPEVKAELTDVLNGSRKIQQLQQLVARDALISASLSRSSYDVGDVFAVTPSGAEILVYVY